MAINKQNIPISMSIKALKTKYQKHQQLYERYFDKDFPLAFEQTEQMVQVANKIGEIYQIAQAKYAKGRVLMKLGNIKGALELIHFIEGQAQQATPNWGVLFISKIHNLLGVLYKSQGKFEQALVNYFRSVDLLKEEEEKYAVNLAGAYLNIANVYVQNKDYDDSLIYLEKAYWIMQAQNSIKGVFYSLNLFGNIYGEKGDIKEARHYYTECLKMLEQYPDPSQQAITYNNLSILSEREKDFKAALEYSFNSLKIKQKLKGKLPIGISYHRIGYIYSKMGNFQDGLNYLKKGLQLMQDIGATPEAVPVLKKIAEAYEGLRDFKSAYQYMIQHTKLKEEVFNDEKAKTIAETQTKFEVKQKEREAELLRQQQQEIQQYAEKLKESNEQLEQFAKVTSHDLKEPLRMVNSYMKLIERKVKPMQDETLDLFLHYAIDGAHRMEKLINDVLDLAKITTNKKPFEEIDLTGMMYVIRRNLSQFLLEKNGEIICSPLPNIKGDSSQIHQLLQNLITNGIKYNDSERPTVNITVKEATDHYLFEITDNGIGIKEEFYQRVFQMLQRLHTRREYAGTGIGLAIVKKIVERHGGKIWVESVVGEGSSFFFTIPKNPVEA